MIQHRDKITSHDKSIILSFFNKIWILSVEK